MTLGQNLDIIDLMVTGLFFNILAGILGIFLSARFIPGISFFGDTYMLIIIGSILGGINFFVKPILKTITLPLRFLTFGLFTLVINMGLIWIVEIAFPKDLEISGIIPLFYATIVIWVLNLIFGSYNDKDNKKI